MQTRMITQCHWKQSNLLYITIILYYNLLKHKIQVDKKKLDAKSITVLLSEKDNNFYNSLDINKDFLQ